MPVKDGHGSQVTGDEGESDAKTVDVGSIDTGSRPVPVKNNRRVVGGGGSLVGRFIQESPPSPPSQAPVVNKGEVGKWERMEMR